MGLSWASALLCVFFSSLLPFPSFLIALNFIRILNQKSPTSEGDFPPKGQVVLRHAKRFELLKTQLAVCQCTPLLALIKWIACVAIFSLHISSKNSSWGKVTGRF